jgi:hypothetical protein
MIGIAMVRLLENNIPLPAWQKIRHQPFILRNPNRTLAPGA